MRPMSPASRGTRCPERFRACADPAFRRPAFPLLAAPRQPPASATAAGRLGWRQAAPATCASERPPPDRCRAQRPPLRPARFRRAHPRPSGDHGSSDRSRRGSSDRSRPDPEPAAQYCRDLEPVVRYCRDPEPVVRFRRGSSGQSRPDPEPAVRSRRVPGGRSGRESGGRSRRALEPTVRCRREPGNRSRRGPAVRSRPACARPRRSHARAAQARVPACPARVPACRARAGAPLEHRRRSSLRGLASGGREQPACRDTRRRTACLGGFRPRVGRSYVLRMLAVVHWSRGRDGRLRRMVTTQSFDGW